MKNNCAKFKAEAYFKQGSYFDPANGEFRRPKDSKKLNSPAWKIYLLADEVLLLTYFHGVIQEIRISAFPNCSRWEISGKNRLRRYSVSTFRVVQPLLFLLHF